MSKYNHYATKLRDSFKEHAEKYQEAADLGERASAAERAAACMISEQYIGEKEVLRADALRMDAQYKAKKAAALQGFAEFDRQAAALRRQLAEDLERDFSMNPDHLDSNTVAILTAGIVNPDQMKELMLRFADNYTMVQTIKGFAQKAEAATEDRDTALQYMRVATMSTDPKAATLAEFDNIISIARTCSGNSRNNRDNESESYVLSMLPEFERLAGEYMDNF